MNHIIEKIAQVGIIPVVKIDVEKAVLPLAKALQEGGIPVIEITYRTELAPRAIQLVKSNFPQMLIGAGTMLTPEQVRSAKAAGADFIVSPGFSAATSDECNKNDLLYIPGAITPSEIETVMALGYKTVKFFPAEAAGGLKMIKALAAPYQDITFIPTGGIDLDNLQEYMSFSKVIACGGSFMVQESLIKQGAFDKIKELSERAVECIIKARKEAGK